MYLDDPDDISRLISEDIDSNNGLIWEDGERAAPRTQMIGAFVDEMKKGEVKKVKIDGRTMSLELLELPASKLGGKPAPGTPAAEAAAAAGGAGETTGSPADFITNNKEKFVEVLEKYMTESNLSPEQAIEKLKNATIFNTGTRDGKPGRLYSWYQNLSSGHQPKVLQAFDSLLDDTSDELDVSDSDLHSDDSLEDIPDDEPSYQDVSDSDWIEDEDEEGAPGEEGAPKEAPTDYEVPEEWKKSSQDYYTPDAKEFWVNTGKRLADEDSPEKEAQRDELAEKMQFTISNGEKKLKKIHNELLKSKKMKPNSGAGREFNRLYQKLKMFRGNIYPGPGEQDNWDKEEDYYAEYPKQASAMKAVKQIVEEFPEIFGDVDIPIKKYDTRMNINEVSYRLGKFPLGHIDRLIRNGHLTPEKDETGEYTFDPEEVRELDGIDLTSAAFPDKYEVEQSMKDVIRSHLSKPRAYTGPSIMPAGSAKPAAEDIYHDINMIAEMLSEDTDDDDIKIDPAVLSAADRGPARPDVFTDDELISYADDDDDDDDDDEPIKFERSLDEYDTPANPRPKLADEIATKLKNVGNNIKIQIPMTVTGSAGAGAVILITLLSESITENYENLPVINAMIGVYILN